MCEKWMVGREEKNKRNLHLSLNVVSVLKCEYDCFLFLGLHILNVFTIFVFYRESTLKCKINK